MTGRFARNCALVVAPFALALVLVGCSHESLRPRTTAESAGQPEVALEAARARLGRFERALAGRDVDRVRDFFSETLLARQSTEETRALVSSLLVEEHAPRWVQICRPRACGQSRYSAGWMQQEGSGIAAIEIDRAGRVTTFRSYEYQCRAHTGCWSVFLPE